jgi:hypothetical protein
MRSTRNHRKALTAMALGFAIAALFTTTASAQVRSEAVGASSSEISYLSWGATADDLGPFAAAQAPSFSRITSPAELYAGQAEPAQSEISYLSWGATADDLGPFQQKVVDRTKLPDGGNYDYSSDNSVAAAARNAGVGVANVGVAQPDGYQPQLQGDQAVIIRDKPDGFQPQTKVVESATVSASSDSLDRGDLALGFGLGLILATAGAIALAMTRDRQRTHMAHS